jgi:hypothetical protein
VLLGRRKPPSALRTTIDVATASKAWAIGSDAD